MYFQYGVFSVNLLCLYLTVMDCYRLRVGPNRRPVDEESRKESRARRGWSRNLPDLPQARCSAGTIAVGTYVGTRVWVGEGGHVYDSVCVRVRGEGHVYYCVCVCTYTLVMNGDNHS